MSRLAPVLLLLAVAALWLIYPPSPRVVRLLEVDRTITPLPLIGIDQPRTVPPRVEMAEPLPAASYRYRRAITAAAKRAFGLHAPVAMLAAQIRQESNYRNDLTSNKGAQGMAQFMPPTAEGMAKQYPHLLHPARPRDPSWALLAQALHMRDLMQSYPAAHTHCDRAAFALAAYNGGPRALDRERAQAPDPSKWSGNVERQRSRTAAAWRENRGYVRRILRVLEPAYDRAGWGGGLGCANA